MWDDFANAIEHLRSADRLRSLNSYRHDGVHLVDQDGRRFINFGSNDYLGLAASNDQVTEASGVGATASSLICGWTDRHQELADAIADLEGTESSVIFPSGFAACSGTIATVARSGDVILSDQLNHASLIDGCRLARAECVVYPHRDTSFLRTYLQQHRSRSRRAWIVSDGVFSMDGHIAPLEELCDLGEAFGATVIVDEAHGTGVLGEHGSGVCEALSVKNRVGIRIGTLSKAIGSQGGFVAGPKVIIDYLINHARTLIYSTSLSMPAVEKAIKSIARIRRHPERRIRVQALARRLREHLQIASSPIEANVPIIPIRVGEDARAITAAQRLRRMGLFVPAIRPPTVPEGEARLRVSLSASHSDQMLTDLIEGIGDI